MKNSSNCYTEKLSGHHIHLYGQFILQTDVYNLDPDHLQWDQSVVLSSNERFYYYLRENYSREVSGQGWWRATGYVKKFYTNYNNQLLVGFKRPLTFHLFREYQHIERRRKNAIKTNWIMHEYSLQSYSMEWRLCRIKYKGKPRIQEQVPEDIGNASIPILAEQQQQQQQQPQSLLPISEANVFSNISGGESLNNQQCSLEVNKLSENESLNFADLNTQMEVMDVEKQQQITFYDPYYDYFEDDQLKQFIDSSEQLFPSIWSWHEDIHRND